MADKTATSPVVMAAPEANAAVPAGTPKKPAAIKAKQTRAKPTHPKTAEMVVAAIAALKERGGSSLQAIKKYIAGTYKVDAEKQATFIKKFLKAAVTSGVLIQSKGKGAAGSFKLPSSKGESIKPKVKRTTKAAVTKKAAVAKKPASAKIPASVATKKAPTKKAAAKAITEKKKQSKGPAAKPPKSKTMKTKPAAAKSPAKKAKPVAPKKAKATVPKAKKAAPKKTVSKK